jgi:hypothetical protein
MEQRSDHPIKHVCVFELERTGGYVTGDVICARCGFKPSSPGSSALKENDNQRHL